MYVTFLIRVVVRNNNDKIILVVSCISICVLSDTVYGLQWVSYCVSY